MRAPASALPLVATVAALIAALVWAAPAGAATPTVATYDLGDVALPDRSGLGPLPVRLRGVVAAPTGAGRRPLVLVLHGRHADGCPAGPLDSETWPCPDVQRRHDEGLRHVAFAIARRGMVAVAPDLAAAFTGGWGEPDDRRRWPRIVDRTLTALAQASAAAPGDAPPFGVELSGRIALRRIGVLGHSRSGANAVRAARSRDRPAARTAARIAAGRGPWRSLLLLTPTGDGGRVPAGVPTTVVLADCDGDVGDEGAAYLRAARRRTPAPRLLQVTLRGANHNFFNRTLARSGFDDAPLEVRRCRRSRRLRAPAQQRWIARVAATHFAVTLRSAPRPTWLRRSADAPRRIAGLPVAARWARSSED
ncbi:MAG: hypothetical protein M0P31_05095 [Solirubrobacteraceae bacterium]|nr:hypothetical protein [Solirubrobacteraceae bacterium]